ncbi:pectate lyase [Flavilitoribacter nigricans]|uniref:Pectate lyase n=1 Tax=Flavilitoribacter nigricans (strain ATCC 23147 / DSM 23189 / NBRC 102662 / NCIMB 1420 / SS-2) TaxID=1122177 RepID=A0A2D0NC14_FLAN2|nr:pectate lyase [Flavilitoribacter nigricans]PHN05918.1 pectate lyase [Flavilitoribacter nigricans DSM 23189 = NBRC 102662]
MNKVIRIGYLFLFLTSLLFSPIARAGGFLMQQPLKKQSTSADPGRQLRWWQDEISKKPYSWYRSEEGLQMAENILSWQDEGTGWPLMSTVREPFTGDLSRVGPWGKRAALVKATVNELRFLARAYAAVEDERYRTALLGGLDFILNAQQETGGWPKSVSQKTGYYRYATYNDDVIPDLMTFLGEVLTAADFRTIGEEKMQAVKTAYASGLEFILNSQIRVEGKRTAWAQQYDPVSLEPRPARAFEPVAISGGESAAVLHFLMSIRKPAPEVEAAIEAGVAWYRQVQIDGLEVIRTEDDLRVKANSAAGPHWARFYEIGTNKPIFAGRDGVIRYQVGEIEAERRRGYAWYNTSGTKVLERYGEWRHERQWDDFPPTNTDESRVREYTLPDPLRMEDGRPVQDRTDWEQSRRPELLALFETHQHGKTPDTPVRVVPEVIEKDVPGMGGLSRRTQVRIGFPDHPEVSPIRLLINVPAEAKGPVPILLHISFTPNVLLFDEPGIDEGMAWSGRMQMRIPDRDALLLKDIHPELFLKKGYGLATVYYGDIEPDFDHGGQYGIRALFPSDGKRKPDEWGSIGAWSWGLSRIMDYLETDPAMDSRKVALSGVSRLGKTVIWAAAADERFAMAIPMLSGEGGAAISRRNYGETIADLTNPLRYHYWFAPRYEQYAGAAGELPVDGHLLLSLIAPRPVLQIVGSTDTWSDPMGEWVAARAAAPVYALYDREGITGGPEPELEKPLLLDMGFYMHEGGHRVLPGDFAAMLDFMDRHFR